MRPDYVVEKIRSSIEIIHWTHADLVTMREIVPAEFANDLPGASLKMSFDEWSNNWMGLTDKHGFTLAAPGESYGTWRGISPKGGSMDEWPERLRIREFPKQKVLTV